QGSRSRSVRSIRRAERCTRRIWHSPDGLLFHCLSSRRENRSAERRRKRHHLYVAAAAESRSRLGGTKPGFAPENAAQRFALGEVNRQLNVSTGGLAIFGAGLGVL